MQWRLIATFLVELEPILFQIDSVQNKYRVIRINIRNDSPSPLKLSLEKDSIQSAYGRLPRESRRIR
jgi:hypothetical protein